MYLCYGVNEPVYMEYEIKVPLKRSIKGLVMTKKCDNRKRKVLQS